MRIVFKGENPASFVDGFAERLGVPAELVVVPDRVESGADRAAMADADAIVANVYGPDDPVSHRLRILHVPAAGYDRVDLAAVPTGAVVCNCFGHEQAIAEYVMAALLARAVPLAEADRDLRAGTWTYWAGDPARVHREIAGTTIGLLGFGHIGKAIAARAKAFEMEVVVANRSAVAPSPLVDRAFTLDQLPAFFAAADVYVVSVPQTADTQGIVGREAFAAMRPHALVMNVGRGPTIDEEALYEALASQRIGGAVIDTWYRYPTAPEPTVLPSRLPFQDLPNLVMTPHMSGWTDGTIRRRRNTMADNIRRRMTGEACTNVVRDEIAPS